MSGDDPWEPGWYSLTGQTYSAPIIVATRNTRMTTAEKRALRTAGHKVAQWTAERDRLIREAVEAGSPLREVGGLVDLSHTAVRFIAKGR